jgi:pyridinium-3,5-biscarboxylic acid mononucleotide sulfurtransferase
MKKTSTSRDLAPLPPTLRAKEDALHEILADFSSVIVAFSGGADSAYLAYAATDVLGARALAVTADSASYEIMRTNELERPEYRANPANRCYYCKHELYTELQKLKDQRGFSVVVDGSNADDRGDYRPGRQAAREFGVRSPLDEASLAKDEIRELSRRAGLPTWDTPASACLSSRIPYGSAVTEEKLRVIESAEAILRGLGFRVFRVRHHETIARLEIAKDEMGRALDPEVSTILIREIRALGYEHVTIDLQGYRQGSLNDVLRLRPI